MRQPKNKPSEPEAAEEAPVVRESPMRALIDAARERQAQRLAAKRER